MRSTREKSRSSVPVQRQRQWSLVTYGAPHLTASHMAAFEPPSWAAQPTGRTSMLAHARADARADADADTASATAAAAAAAAAAASPIALNGRSYYVLGRNSDTCDVVVDHSSASRMHAALVHHTNGRCAPGVSKR